jgi:glycosyltransferase involved in cell wall biosynthesis
MPSKIILYTLRTFSTTGGIQKMTRTLAYSLYHVAEQEKWDFQMWSLYDSRYDLMAQYLAPDKFTGFSRNKLKLAFYTLFKAPDANVIILSHVNLGLLGLIIKILNPKCQVWMVAHGIEVWRPLSFFKKRFVQRFCDKFLCVSSYTQSQMINWHQVDAAKCVVLNNVIDPFIKHPDSFEKPEYLMNRYSLELQNQVIFTLTRLASSEQYKGYEQVIRAVSSLKNRFPKIKYILSGQYDSTEEVRIKQLISTCGVEEQVILTGFLKEKELADYFLLADLFVLPSRKEGFGIVFIEALACGLPVICGNADGSVDAIRNGELGTAINVNDLVQLEKTIAIYLENPITVKERQSLQHLTLRYFNEHTYQRKLLQMITNELVS